MFFMITGWWHILRSNLSELMVKLVREIMSGEVK